jgi:hypothetical protein
VCLDGEMTHSEIINDLVTLNSGHLQGTYKETMGMHLCSSSSDDCK